MGAKSMANLRSLRKDVVIFNAVSGCIFSPEEPSSCQYPPKNKQAYEQYSYAFVAGVENECPKVNERPKLLTHCTSKLVRGDTSFPPNCDPRAKKCTVL